MTALRRIFLRCDICEDHLDTDTVPSAETVVQARQQAHRAGWVHTKTGRDICDNCRAGGTR